MTSNAKVERERGRNRDGDERPQAVRTKPATRHKKMPCGATTCLHCHAQCGAVMADYILKDLDTPED